MSIEESKLAENCLDAVNELVNSVNCCEAVSDSACKLVTCSCKVFTNLFDAVNCSLSSFSSAFSDCKSALKPVDVSSEFFERLAESSAFSEPEEGTSAEANGETDKQQHSATHPNRYLIQHLLTPVSCWPHTRRAYSAYPPWADSAGPATPAEGSRTLAASVAARCLSILGRMHQPISTDLAVLAATELTVRYADGSLSPVDATQVALDRIHRDNDRVNAFNLVDAEGALAAARESETRWRTGQPLGPLDGVPCSIKDILDARGWPTLRGSRTIERDQDWRRDAPPVARLREGGAVLLGRTTTPEFGWKGVTDSPLTGITRNPWDVSRTPGGSSGGAAVAAALGMGAVHVGSDSGGSIRIPAGYSGAFGLKPSFGRVPNHPPSVFGTISHVGPITRSVADAAVALTVLSGAEPRDWLALPPQGDDYRVGLDQGLAGLRVGYSPALGMAEVAALVDAEVAAAVEVAAQDLAALGATVELADPPLADARSVFDVLWACGLTLVIESIPDGRRHLMDPGLIAMAEHATSVSGAEYAGAMARRSTLGAAMCEYHLQYDVLVTPTLPLPAFAAGQDVAAPQTQRHWVDWTPFTYPFNLTQQPAASIPCGRTSGGLPIGLQIIGPMHRDDLVLRVARAYEGARPIELPAAPVAAGGSRLTRPTDMRP